MTCFRILSTSRLWCGCGGPDFTGLKTTEEKKDILEQVTGLSKRETEKKLAVLAPRPPKPDQTRELDGEKTELRVTLDQETIAALGKIRDLIAHAHPGASYAEVITLLTKLGLKKWDPAAEKAQRKASSNKAEKATDTENAEKASKKVSFPRRKKSRPPHGGRFGEGMEGFASM